MIKLKPLLASLVISLGVGGLSALLTPKRHGAVRRFEAASPVPRRAGCFRRYGLFSLF